MLQRTVWCFTSWKISSVLLVSYFGVWMITLCSSWEKTVEGIWVWILGAPGGLLGTAAAYPEPQPYQDPSARHSATLLTLSIPLSVFLPQSLWLGLLFGLYPFPDLCHPPQRSATSQQKSKCCWHNGSSSFLMTDSDCVYERFSLLTSPLRYVGSGWRVQHIQYCVYGYWRQSG